MIPVHAILALCLVFQVLSLRFESNHYCGRVRLTSTVLNHLVLKLAANVLENLYLPSIFSDSHRLKNLTITY